MAAIWASVRTWPLRLLRPLSASRFQRLAEAAVAGLFLVTVSGAVVRLTDSGLGCDNWPNCGETLLPAQEFHATVEFANRAVVVVGILPVIAAAIGAFRVSALPRHVRVTAAAALLGTIVQIPLGGITVRVGLHPLAVMSHFLLALIVLGLATVVVVEARRFARGGSAPVPDSQTVRWVGRLAVALVPLAAVLVVTGAFVTAAGPHAGDEGVRRLGDFWEALRVHVWVSGAFGIGFAGLLAGLWRLRRLTLVELRVGLVVLAVLVAQLVIGEVQKESGLPWELVLAHVVLATLVWIGMVAVGARLVRHAQVGARAAVRREYTLGHR